MNREGDRNREYDKDTYATDGIYRMNVWGGDKENSRDYWSRFNRIFHFGYEKCEMGEDFDDVNEYISEHSFE